VKFLQRSDTSYEVVARVKNFRFDDLREANKGDTVVHMMDRHFTVDPNVFMLIASLEFNPKDQTHSMAQRLCNR
jgi:hypothetical protein